MKSQKDQILEYLKAGNSITPLESLEIFKCLRLSGRIMELRKEGYDIITETEERHGKKYARYRLNDKPAFEIRGKQIEWVA